eukprot:846432-Prymnesium_polylepis.2
MSSSLPGGWPLAGHRWVGLLYAGRMRAPVSTTRKLIVKVSDAKVDYFQHTAAQHQVLHCQGWWRWTRALAVRQGSPAAAVGRESARRTLQVAVRDANAVHVAHSVRQHRKVRLQVRTDGRRLGEEARVDQDVKQLALGGLHDQVVRVSLPQLLDHADDVAVLSGRRPSERAHLRLHHFGLVALHLDRDALAIA